MSLRLSKGAADRIANAVRKVENLPESTHSLDMISQTSVDQDVFVPAIVTSLGEYKFASGKYDITKPIKVRRLVENPSKGPRILMIRMNASTLSLVINGVELSPVFPSVVTDAGFQQYIDAEWNSQGPNRFLHGTVVAGRFLFLGGITGESIDVKESSPTLTLVNQWPLSEEEEFPFARQSETARVGDEVNVLFSADLGGQVIPPPEVFPDPIGPATPCCDARVINRTDLNVGGYFTAGIWNADLGRDMTVATSGGSCSLLAGSYALPYSSQTGFWGIDLRHPLYFGTYFTIMTYQGEDITSKDSSSGGAYPVVNSALLTFKHDNGAGLAELKLDLDVDIIS